MEFVRGGKKKRSVKSRSRKSRKVTKRYASNVAKGQLLVTLGNSIFGDGGSLSFLNPLNWFKIG